MESTNILLTNSEEFFARKAETGFLRPKFFACNPKGDTIFGVRINFQTLFTHETGEFSVALTERCISQTLIRTGESLTYRIDEAIPAIELRRGLEFYMIVDQIGVLITYNRELFQLTQFALMFDRKNLVAKLLIARKVTLTDLSYDVGIGLGGLHRGSILVTGSRGPFDGERQVVAHSLTANPMIIGEWRHEDLTEKIAEFNSYLHSYDPSLKLFASGVLWDEKGLYFLLRDHRHLDVIVPDRIGRILFNSHEKEERCQIIDISDGCMRYGGFIGVQHLSISVQRGRHLWMVLTPPDYEKMDTYGWYIYIKCLPKLIKVITFVLEMMLRIRNMDNGFCLRAYLKVLTWVFGPTMIPQLEPDKCFLLYNLDLKQPCLRQVDYEPPLSYTGNLHLPVHPVSMDCDQDGGLVYTELPLDPDDATIVVRSVAAPHEPAALERLAAQKVYRLFPAVEKSAELRRLLGLTDCSWVM